MPCVGSVFWKLAWREGGQAYLESLPMLGLRLCGGVALLVGVSDQSVAAFGSAQPSGLAWAATSVVERRVEVWVD